MNPFGRSALTDFFVRGETAKLVGLPLAVFEKAGRAELLVGALVLSGDFERALAVGQRLEAKDHTGIVAFYLSLGFSRAGRYDEAERRIRRLERLAEVDSKCSGSKLKSDLLEFYCAQARGFLCFSQGLRERAVDHARGALVAAEASNDSLQPLARTLSLDLLGHSLVQIGFTRRGIKTLRLAREAAVRANHAGFDHAIAISLLKYSAVFGLEPSRVVARLFRALVELKPNDSYSRSELRLELARQLILRGNLREARRHLEETATDVLGSQNHIQTAALHVRLAWMARLEGRPGDALLALQSAETCLNPADTQIDEKPKSAVNRELLMKVDCFRLSLLKQLARRPEAQELEAKLSRDRALVTQKGIESRLSRRHQHVSQDDHAISTEDPFGDLMDRVQRRDPGIEKELLENRYFGLLLPMFGLNLGQNAIVLGVPAGKVIVLDSGEARLSTQGLKGLLGRLLFRLASGACTRREAIEVVWGYSYEAERHDRLLAVAVSRIRKSLGGAANWIEIQGDRLVLRDDVVVRFWSNSIITTSISTQFADPRRIDAIPVSSKNTRGLRIRQLQVLSELVTQGDVGVQDLVERFGISRASALRDLNELVAKEFVVRTGETRATRYMLAART